MKTNRVIFYLLIVVAILIAGALLYNKKKTIKMPVATSSATDVASPAGTIISQTPSVPLRSNRQVSAVTQTQPQESKNQNPRQDLAILNDEDIVLYGRVIDQFGLPVTDAKVTGSIQVNNGARVGADKVSLLTDDNGFFTINGYKGKSLGINISKAGYVMASTNTFFIYSLLWPESKRYIPDQGNPAVIKMWKLQGAQSLVNINKTYKLPYTDSPINFDLISGDIVPSGGDLKISVKRPSGEVSEHNPQNWSIDFQVVGGGFIETSDREWGVTYAAPENGYQPDGTFANNNGPDMINEALFVVSRNGQIYSKIGFSFRINNTADGLMYITFAGVANTNASRNWEATAPQ